MSDRQTDGSALPKISEEEMRTLIVILIVTLFSTPAIAKKKTFNDDFFPARPSSLGIQEDLTYWPVAIGVLYMPLPTNEDSVALPSFSFGWMHVDESFMHSFEGKVGLSSVSQVADFSYTFGFGQRKGLWHVGMQARLGYAHLYDSAQDHLHGLHYSLGPCVNFSLPWFLRPEKWRFYIATGWAGIAVSNGDYKDNRQLKAWFLDFGVAFSIKGT